MFDVLFKFYIKPCSLRIILSLHFSKRMDEEPVLCFTRIAEQMYANYIWEETSNPRACLWLHMKLLDYGYILFFQNDIGWKSKKELDLKNTITWQFVRHDALNITFYKHNPRYIRNRKGCGPWHNYERISVKHAKKSLKSSWLTFTFSQEEPFLFFFNEKNTFLFKFMRRLRGKSWELILVESHFTRAFDSLKR